MDSYWEKVFKKMDEEDNKIREFPVLEIEKTKEYCKSFELCEDKSCRHSKLCKNYIGDKNSIQSCTAACGQ